MPRRSAPSPRIVIVTPSPIGSNPRVVKEADALWEAGFDVSVIATRTLDRVDQRDAALMQRIGWPLKRIDLRGRGRRSVHRAVQMAARSAFLATGVRALADLGGSAVTQPLLHEACLTPADLYIAHYPAALPAVAAAARRHGALYAFDAEDFHPGDWPADARYETERRLVETIERGHLRGAAFVTAAAPAIAEAYASLYDLPPPAVTLNAFPVAQAPARPAAQGRSTLRPSIYWFSQTIGPHRGLECAIAAIGLSSSRPHLFLRGHPVPGYVTELERLAERAGAGHRVHLLPPAPPDQMERIAARYDLGLAAETGHSLNRQLCLTNKLFTFLLAGLPPLMSATTAQSAFAAEAGLSELIFPIDDAAALARLMDQLLGHRKRLAELRQRIWALGQSRYNWEQEKSGVVDRVASALATRPVPHARAGGHGSRARVA